MPSRRFPQLTAPRVGCARHSFWRMGFTLIELLVGHCHHRHSRRHVVASPFQGQNEGDGHTLHEQHQTARLAWQMYALDNNDSTLGPLSETGVPGWCDGVYDQVPDGITNRILINSPTYKYVKNPQTFRCAADRSQFRYQNQLQPRVISFSANAFFGPPSGYVSGASQYRNVRKMSQMTSPGPTRFYVLLDEHENSINDAHYFPFDNMLQYSRNKWFDAPSGRHGNAGGFVFADGHSEIHKWRTAGLTKVVKGADGVTSRPYPDLPFIGPSELADFQWMTDHIAPPK